MRLWPGILVLLIGAAPTGVAAQSRPGFDCNLLGPTEPCDPFVLYPPGGDLRATLRSRTTEGLHRKEGQIDTLRELFHELAACWQPPPLDAARTGMDLSIRFSSNRFGNIIRKPRFTYVNRKASAEQQDLYRRSVVDGLLACMPLPFTRGLGGAIAGRPLVIRYIDDRNTRTAGIF